MSERRPPDLAKLEALVRRLRAPDGCPWDRKQRLGDVRAYLLEEAHEAAAAIDRALAGDGLEPLREELGDLLFQVVFLAVLADERGAFDLAAAIDGIHHKMVARHPHVFGGEALADASAVQASWERRKLADRAAGASLLDGVAASLPALVAAYRLTQKAAGVGFDWPDVEGPIAKVREELAEVEAALADTGGDPGGTGGRHLREEVGDLLFAAANVARKAGIDPEAALAAANAKFRRRFGAVEAAFDDAETGLADASLAEMDAAWERVKAAER